MKNIIETINGINIIDDKELGYIHVDPLPTNDESEKFYKDVYFQEENIEYFKKKEEDIEWLETFYNDKYSSFEKFLPEDQRTLIDVGSGSGYFLQYGKKRNWNVSGIEPSTLACKFSKDHLGIEVINNIFARKTIDALGKFNVVHLHNVLEHVPNPFEIIDLSKEIILEKGLISITVPNDFNNIQNIASENMDIKKWWIDPTHHLNYFNVESLSNILTKKGFEILVCETSFPIDMFLLMGDNYIDNKDLGRGAHIRRKNFELNLSKHNNNLKRQLFESFAKLGIGRELTIVARKK